MALRAVYFGPENRAMVAQVQALRKAIFVDHCGWQLRVEGDREVDEFDGPDAVHLALQDDDGLCGCFRLMRTDRPYLASTVFPDLAVTRPYPTSADTWEVSRFGVLPGPRAAHHGRVNYAVMFAFAQRTAARALVAVAGLDHERFLRAIGIRTRRYGPPREIGRSHSGRPLQAVAGEIVPALQDASRLQELFNLIRNVEIVDDAELLGPGRVSA